MSSLEEEEEGRALSVGSRCVFCNTTLVLNAEGPSQRQERVLEYRREFSPELAPPIHMAIAYGPIETPKLSNLSFVTPPLAPDHLCQLCLKPFDGPSDSTLLSLHCPLRCPQGVWHIVCLARHLTSEAAKRPLSSASSVYAEEPSKPQLLPLNGICPSCEKAEFLWPELLASQQPGTFK
ncbi:Structure-specific endonuclease subunit SLX1 [Sparganum proliferum]